MFHKYWRRFVLRPATSPSFVLQIAPGIALRPDAPAPISESVSVIDPHATGQEICAFRSFWVLHPQQLEGAGLDQATFTPNR